MNLRGEKQLRKTNVSKIWFFEKINSQIDQEI